MTDSSAIDSGTARKVEFAPWPTDVENDDLTLVGLRFGGRVQVDSYKEGVSLAHRESYAKEECELEASFLSIEKEAVAVFRFSEVSAFRVLDEHGLTELWATSDETPKPAHSTFLVKGHGWQAESPLVWFHGGSDFSYMIATGWACLEVVTDCEPVVVLKPASG